MGIISSGSQPVGLDLFESHVKYPLYQIHILQFIAVKKLQSRSVNNIILQLEFTTPDTVNGHRITKVDDN